MKIVLISDAWEPQVNGVVRTLRTVVEELRAAGDQVTVLHPGLFKTWPCPTYPEIRLAPLARSSLARMIEEASPDAVHIATEGPLGMAGRALCLRRDWPFTTAFHTRFPEYVHARFRVPTGLTYRAMRWFHRPSTRVMVATPSLQEELTSRGFDNAALWSRGVDTELFRPQPEASALLDLPRPIHAFVGRVAVEKNLGAFLELDLPGTKLVVGDGPQRRELELKYPDAVFVGARHGQDLARHYAAADVFVFPRRTDTYGLVLLEALASGVPCAAFPVPGPIDVLDATVGVMDENLEHAVVAALELSPQACRAYALERTWAHCAELFKSHLAPLEGKVSSQVDAA